MIDSILMVWINGSQMGFINHLRKKQSIPMIAMFSIDWCPHCKQIAPIFNKVAKEYNDNENIVFTSIDCKNDEDFCRKMDISSYPSFILAMHNLTTNMPFLNNEKLLKNTISRVLEFKNFNFKDVENNIFPYFEFTVSGNDEISKNIIDIVIASSSLDFNRFKINERNLQYLIEPKLVVHIDKYLQVPMDEQFKPYQLQNFIKQNSIPIFGDWTFQTINHLNKRVAILLTNDITDYQKYKYLAKKFYDKFVWLNDNGVKQFDIASKYWSISKSDLPAIIIMDSKATYYSALKNINDSTKMIEYEGLLQRDVLQRNYFKVDFYSEQRSLRMKSTIIIFLQIFSGVTFVCLLAAYIFMKIKDNRKKVE